ncbi:MAG TPA: Tol-Pal system protein TolB [Hyphomicrobiaceae bacterium MAG_BT-2024]
MSKSIGSARLLPNNSISRRSALRILGSSVATCVLPKMLMGQTRIIVNESKLIPQSLAISNFIGEDKRLGTAITKIVKADLERSGLFRFLEQKIFLQKTGNIDVSPRFLDWRSIGAEALVVGRTIKQKNGRFTVQFRLWDIVLGKLLTGQQFSIAPKHWRRLGHLVADQVYQKLTLVQGYFDTRIVFIDETGSKQQRLKRLAIMDQDGHNLQILSDGRELVITPRFNPVQQEVAYMSYVDGQPRVLMMDLTSGQHKVVGDFPGMTFAPRYSPDGERIVMSFQQGTNSWIVEMDFKLQRLRRLTESNAIDTGPCFSPDGRNIVFESDRDGSQQLYIMNHDGSNQRRISRGDGTYSTPVWSPRGDNIAFTKQYAGRFLIGVVSPDGARERILTEGFHNEGPTWAPNGRVLMFFRDARGADAGPKIFSIDLTGYNERLVKTPAFASDPSWSSLLG